LFTVFSCFFLVSVLYLFIRFLFMDRCIWHSLLAHWNLLRLEELLHGQD
jgi:hypothetical protein